MEPLLMRGEYGRAEFDSVGPLLLISWSEVGPGLLQAIITTGLLTVDNEADQPGMRVFAEAGAGTAFRHGRVAAEWRADTS